jgi:hypothetical protein
VSIDDPLLDPGGDAAVAAGWIEETTGWRLLLAPPVAPLADRKQVRPIMLARRVLALWDPMVDLEATEGHPILAQITLLQKIPVEGPEHLWVAQLAACYCSGRFWRSSHVNHSAADSPGESAGS